MEYVHLLCLVCCLLAVAESAGRCRRMNLENGMVSYRSRGRIATFECDRGYSLMGVGFLACFSGRWDKQPPVCVKPGCPELPVLRNGQKRIASRGAIIRFRCNSGNTLIGPKKIYCDGVKWSAEMPICRPNEPPPLECDLEDEDICGWSNDPTADVPWRWHQFDTPSSVLGTGPGHDHSLGHEMDGHYLYMESSAPTKEGDKARLISPLFREISNNNTCFIFWYHMYGTTVGTLNVYVGQTMLFTASGNKGNRWIKGIVPVYPTRDFDITIEAISGGNFMSDIAVDDFHVTNSSSCKIVDSDLNTCAGRCFSNHIPHTTACLCTMDCMDNSTCCEDFEKECIVELTTEEEHENHEPSTTEETTKGLLTTRDENAGSIEESSTDQWDQAITSYWNTRSAHTSEEHDESTSKIEIIAADIAPEYTTHYRIPFTSEEVVSRSTVREGMIHFTVHEEVPDSYNPVSTIDDGSTLKPVVTEIQKAGINVASPELTHMAETQGNDAKVRNKTQLPTTKIHPYNESGTNQPTTSAIRTTKVITTEGTILYPKTTRSTTTRLTSTTPRTTWPRTTRPTTTRPTTTTPTTTKPTTTSPRTTRATTTTSTTTRPTTTQLITTRSTTTRQTTTRPTTKRPTTTRSTTTRPTTTRPTTRRTTTTQKKQSNPKGKSDSWSEETDDAEVEEEDEDKDKEEDDFPEPVTRGKIPIVPKFKKWQGARPTFIPKRVSTVDFLAFKGKNKTTIGKLTTDGYSEAMSQDSGSSHGGVIVITVLVLTSILCLLFVGHIFVKKQKMRLRETQEDGAGDVLYVSDELLDFSLATPAQR